MSGTELRGLSESRCWELLESASVGRLAVSISNHPDIFPVNFAVNDKTIVIRTAEGQKLAAAVFGTAVAFEVDALDGQHRTGWSVVIQGSAEEPERLEDYLQAEDLDIEPWARGEKNRYIIIRPTRVTGRLLPPAITSCVLDA